MHVWRYLRKHPKLLFLDFLGLFFVLLGPLPTILADGRQKPSYLTMSAIWSVIMFLVMRLLSPPPTADYQRQFGRCVIAMIKFLLHHGMSRLGFQFGNPDNWIPSPMQV